MKVVNTEGRVLRINAPEWFQIQAFCTVLQNGTHPLQKQRLATFHRHGNAPGVWSDVFVPFEIHSVGMDGCGQDVWQGEGAEIWQTDGLEDVWNAIVLAAKENGMEHGIVWISNIPD